MSGKSSYLEGKLIDHSMGKAAFTMPTVYIALCTVMPTVGMSGATITEATYTGYSRKIINAADMNAAASGSASNANYLTFAQCTAGSSVIVAVALVDAPTIGTGNLLRWVGTGLTVSTGVTPTVAVGGLTVNET